MATCDLTMYTRMYEYMYNVHWVVSTIYCIW